MTLTHPEPGNYCRLFRNRGSSTIKHKIYTIQYNTIKYNRKYNTVASCPQNSEKLRHGRQHHTISLHLGYPRQDDVCYQCLVGIRHCGWQTASWRIYRTCSTRWSVPSRWTKPASVLFLTGTKHCLHEYWRINIMCCDNCYQILPLTTTDYAVEGTTIHTEH